MNLNGDWGGVTGEFAKLAGQNTPNKCLNIKLKLVFRLLRYLHKSTL